MAAGLAEGVLVPGTPGGVPLSRKFFSAHQQSSANDRGFWGLTGRA